MTVEKLAVSWTDFFMNGSLIDLDISMWDGMIRLAPEDLGIVKTDEVREAITFGHERLVPKDALQFIRGEASLARDVIDTHTIPFKLVPGSRFLPVNMRESLKASLEKIQANFVRHANEFIANYDAIREAHKFTLARALLQSSGNQEVADKALRRIEDAAPSAEKLREAFAMNWRVYSIAAPQDGTGDSNQGSAIMAEITNLVDRLRGQLTEKVRDILELVARGGKITAKTYNSAIRVCDRIDKLNFFADAGLRTAVQAVREAVSAAQSSKLPPEFELHKGLDTITDELTKSREAAIANAAKLMAGEAERRFGL